MGSFGKTLKIREDHAVHICGAGNTGRITGNRDVCGFRKTGKFKCVRIVFCGNRKIGEILCGTQCVCVDRCTAVVIDNRIHHYCKNQRNKFRVSAVEESFVNKR